ncbi:TIM barrel protein [Mucilaginibacter sp. UR6-1]|uniref:sugar phosphate isomerase/epimerase family protein n=1 Tax=Mucilaginibacter sp. UR6-1 TaxID=1435643 RepID=UPI001E630A1D|nr:TIM barrel protein [Mucilaginibacter sp. UR6-1]MCC8410191.1 TIM barrel protein [Mucilaginibacter sp. UR6-1]
MNNSRRNFLKGAAVLAAASAIPGNLLAADNKLQRTVLQLYSVRDEMRADPKATLKRLAELGYRHVEHANYADRKFYGFTVKEFKAILNDNGLTMPSGHTTMARQDWDTSKNDFTDKWKQTVEDAAVIGQRFVISPSLSGAAMMVDEMKPYMDQFNKCGELCKKHGMKFGYHNHDFEFEQRVGGVLLFDFMLQNTDPALVAQQLDMGNMYMAGANAMDYIKKYPNRFELMHVKNMIKVGDENGKPKYESCQLDKGLLPLKQILKAARKTAGTSYFVIEQEEYQGLGQSESAGIDLQVMKKWGY